MAFETYETGDGRPVELITFVNGTTVLRYTNANIAVTVGATTWEPLEYSRNAPSISKDSDDSQIRMKLPASNPVVNFYRNILQSTITSITIERFHENDPTQDVQVFWKGEIGSVTVANAEATLLAVPLSQGTEEMPRYTYQGSCNWFLYESATCRVNRDDYRFVGVITGIAGNGLQITISGLQAAAGAIDSAQSPGGALTTDELNAYWLNGYCDKGGELRRVVRSPGGFSPEDPDTIEIPFPFVSASTGDAITVYAGCNRQTDICNRKFNNLINFGGFPSVPKNINPFETELPKGQIRQAPGRGWWGGNVSKQ